MKTCWAASKSTLSLTTGKSVARVGFCSRAMASRLPAQLNENRSGPLARPSPAKSRSFSRSSFPSLKTSGTATRRRASSSFFRSGEDGSTDSFRTRLSAIRIPLRRTHLFRKPYKLIMLLFYQQRDRYSHGFLICPYHQSSVQAPARRGRLPSFVRVDL